MDARWRSLTISGMALNFVLLPFLGLLLPTLTTQNFASTALLGIYLSLFGMAATLGALSYSTLTKLLSRSVIYYGGLLLTAISIVLCAVVETQSALMGSIGLGGLLLGAGNPLEQTILQEVTSIRIAGQVFTSHTAMSFAAGILGLLLAGVVTELTNLTLPSPKGTGILGSASPLNAIRLPFLHQRWFSPQAFYSLSEVSSGMPYLTGQKPKIWFFCTCCLDFLPSEAFL